MIDFATLFAGTGYISAICLFVGLVFCAIECFIPGFGFFGISGGALIIFSIVYRMIIGGSWWHLFYLCSIVLIVLTVVILIAVRSARYGALSKTAIIENSTALPTDYASDEKNYAFLLNKEGVTSTICKPTGKVVIEDKTYQVITNGEYLEKGSNVKVVEVDGSSIVIKRI